MRTIMYAVFNKETNKKVYTSIDRCRCENYINSLEDKENYTIRYKWFSI